MSTIYDISPLISEDIAVWPGDIAFTRSIQCRLEEGDSVALSSFSATVHLGAHADAPCHYASGAASIDQLDLAPYLGRCIVVTVTGVDLIMPEHCITAVESGAPRILFRTLSQPDPHIFNDDFTALSPKAVNVLGEAGAQLIGIDTPSVDPFSSKELPAHHQLLKWNIRNLEGLNLKSVPDGLYELIALPLKLRGFDASPVRAILRT